MTDARDPIRLSLPSSAEYALVARMAFSGAGLLAGLDVDLIGDLRTVTGECFDCIIHQPSRPARVDMSAWLLAGRLHCRFEAAERGERSADEPFDLTVTRGILETLMPDVAIESDDGGVYAIQCSMPV